MSTMCCDRCLEGCCRETSSCRICQGSGRFDEEHLPDQMVYAMSDYIADKTGNQVTCSEFEKKFFALPKNVQEQVRERFALVLDKRADTLGEDR